MKNTREELSGKSFEDVLGRLEKLVEALERGSLSLEESLSHFEEGTRLVRECTTRLEAAEAKLQELVSSDEGFRLEPLSFSSEEDGEK